MKALDYAAQICYSSRAVLQFSYDMSVKYKYTPGVYVETGVAAGAQIIAFAAGAPNKTIYAFDSFCGLPLPSNRDDQMPGIMKLTPTEQKMLPDPGKQVLETSGATSVSLDDFVDHLRKSIGVDSTSTHPYCTRINLSSGTILMALTGWFEITVPPMSLLLNEISILRLDGDLYNSTWVCLQHLFPKVIQGGCVIVDDWTLKGCQDACKEYFELIGYEPNYQYLDGTAYFFK